MHQHACEGVGACMPRPMRWVHTRPGGSAAARTVSSLRLLPTSCKPADQGYHPSRQPAEPATAKPRPTCVPDAFDPLAQQHGAQRRRHPPRQVVQVEVHGHARGQRDLCCGRHRCVCGELGGSWGRRGSDSVWKRCCGPARRGRAKAGSVLRYERGLFVLWAYVGRSLWTSGMIALCGEKETQTNG
jgi:hypothetical protein